MTSTSIQHNSSNNTPVTDQAHYDQKMIAQYSKDSKKKYLQIQDNQQLISFKFVEQIEIDKLRIYECFKINLQSVPINITTLQINNCNVEKLVGIKQMTQLQSLDLSNNRISDVSELQYLENLTILSLSYNKLSDISPLSALLNLQELYLYRNQINSALQLKNLRNLIKLDLGVNALLDLNGIQYLKNLTRLSVPYNKLVDIRQIKNLTRVQELILCGNQLNNIDVLKNFQNLNMLNLADNKLVDISSIKYLQNLTHLYILNNLIVHIDALRNLSFDQLEISSNDIISFEPVENHKNFKNYSIDEQQQPKEKHIRLSKRLKAVFDSQELLNLQQEKKGLIQIIQKEQVEKVVKSAEKAINDQVLMSKQIVFLFQVLSQATCESNQ
ncbi:leucine-rich_repeat domain-containing protein [Hexamita inflata]|uniref:Leucine-rich repeat domain-containing protein n=1 Tax=Hexamita inflata TaxID=28002 RepID=A0AA86NHG4_9EUKA|nr:leucine-rich repeat domain-containing protein [Hexamita inflata]